MSNETKVGLLAVVTLVLSVLGYNFLKGINLVNAPNIIYADFNNVASLPIGAPVSINGLQVGVVKEMYFKENLQNIRVAMNIEKEYLIPKDATAVITSGGIMGGASIVLDYTGVCSGPDCVQHEAVIDGRVASAIESYLGKPEELDPYFLNLRNNIGPLTDTIKRRLTDPNSDDDIAKTLRNIAIVLENLKETTAGMNRMIAANSRPLNDAMKNTETLTASLAQATPNIQGIMKNTDTLTSNLAQLQLDRTLNSTNEAISSLKTTMSSADKAVAELTTILQKINRGEGAIGKLMTDASVINKLTSMAVKVDSLATDFQERPYRYIPLKSRRKVLKYDEKDGEN